MKQYKIKVNGNPFDVTIASVDENGLAKVVVNGKELDVQVENIVRPAAVQPVASKPAINGSDVKNQRAAVSEPDLQSIGNQPNISGGQTIESPLPGVIISVGVNVGDKVAAGQTIAVLEAMKMENAIEAECAGTITALFVQKGDSVLEGARIATIA